VVQVESARTQELRLGGLAGASLALKPLPYSLPD